MNTIRKIKPSLHIIKPQRITGPDKYVLNNGIPMFVFNDPKMEVFRADIVFEAGHLYAKNPLQASFTGSLLSEGTINNTGNEISESFDFYGAYYNQITDKDRAVIQLFGLTKHAIPLIDLCFDIVSNPIYPDDKLAQQIAIKKQQYSIEKKKVRYIANQNFNAILFGENHPYGMPINENMLNSIQKEQLISYHKKFYTSDKCKIVLSGNITDNIIDYFNDVYKYMPQDNSNIKVNELNSEISFNNKSIRIEVENAIQAAIRIGLRTINKEHKDYPLLQLLNTILGGYFGSRLMKNIREDKGYTYGIGSAVASLKQSGYFFIATETGVKVCNKAIKEIYKEINILKKETISNAELDTVKKYIMGEYLRMFDGVFEKATAFRSANDYGLDFNFYKHYINTITNATPDKLKKIAKKYLIIDNFIEVVAGIK